MALIFGDGLDSPTADVNSLYHASVNLSQDFAAGWLDADYLDGVRRLLAGNPCLALRPLVTISSAFPKAIIDGLMHSGNAYFVQKNGRVLLMAENIKENAWQLNRFKRAERGRTGAKQIKRGQEIPIAVLVRQVDLKRRFDLVAGVRGALPALARAIQQELDRGLR